MSIFHPYTIELESFEGPLDLLLHLIKKHEMEISNISIETIVDQYSAYLNLMEELNIDLAGDFLLMASELAHIKSRMLLPREENPESESEVEDPRSELVRRLLEYQRYKEAAEQIADGPQLGRDVFQRDCAFPQELKSDAPIRADLHLLMESFYRMLRKNKQQLMHQVQFERLSVSERMYELMDLIKGKESVLFSSFFTGQMQRSVLVVTFLALLEMTRMKIISIRQSADCDEIYLLPRMHSVERAEIEGAVSFD